jgi:DNA-binding transcriptional MerR regulator
MSDDISHAAGSAAARGGAGAHDAAKDHILSIDEVARMFAISKLSLWRYEMRGLVRRKRAGRVRVYSWIDCERIALLVKAHKAGLTVARLAPVIKAMDDEAPAEVADAGREKCLALIHALEDRQRRIGDVLGELYRIDWELAERLGVNHAQHKGRASEPF